MLQNKNYNAIEKLICRDWLINELSIQNILENKEYQKFLYSANKIKKREKNLLLIGLFLK